jgi:hypothetical protein
MRSPAFPFRLVHQDPGFFASVQNNMIKRMGNKKKKADEILFSLSLFISLLQNQNSRRFFI